MKTELIKEAKNSKKKDCSYAMYVWITPELAAEWLEKNNINNRKLRKERSEVYARDMTYDNWFPNTDAIGFDINGHLIDGQHRLYGIVLSGKAQRMIVVYDLPVESAKVNNAGLSKKIYEVIEDISKNEVSIANAMLRVSGSDLYHTRPSRMELDRYIHHHSEAIKFVSNLFKTSKFGISRAAVQAAVVRGYYYVPNDIIERFVKVLYDGFIQDETERPIIFLRDSLFQGKSIGGIGEQRTDYGKTERALYAFWKKENISKLYVAKKELFPFPKENFDVI